MNNYKLGAQGSLFYSTWAPEQCIIPVLDWKLVILNIAADGYASTSPIEFLCGDAIPSWSIEIEHLKFIKSSYTKEDTKIEYKKADGNVMTYYGNSAIAFEDLCVDGRKIAVHYLVGDNKVWIPVI